MTIFHNFANINTKGSVELNARLKLLRTQLKISQEAFGKRLGVTAAGISKIESGQRNLTQQMILLICKEFHINEKWLRYGEGQIFQETQPSDLDQLANHYHLDELDLRIIQEFLLLDEKKRKVIKDYILKVASYDLNSNIMTDGTIHHEILQCAEESDLNSLNNNKYLNEIHRNV